MDEKRQKNRPPQNARPPHPRHQLAHVNQRSVRKPLNTVIESWVDVAADVVAINQGDADRRGDIYAVNGRRYRLETTGRLAPFDGPGFHVLNRRAYQARGMYNTLGFSDYTEMILDKAEVSEMDREAARAAWHAEYRGH